MYWNEEECKGTYQNVLECTAVQKNAEERIKMFQNVQEFRGM